MTKGGEFYTDYIGIYLIAFFSSSNTIYSNGAEMYGNVAEVWPLTFTGGAFPYLYSQIFLQNNEGWRAADNPGFRWPGENSANSDM